MNVKIHPSILCANHGELKNEIIKMEEAGADYFHIDVMDGSFVLNFGCGTEIVKTVRDTASIPMDVHLMVVDPARHVKMFCQLGASIITVHPEADKQAARTLVEIKEQGAIPGIAINPGTSVETVKELLPLCGHVLVMTVNPGFGGQVFLDYTIDKIKQLGELAKHHGFSLCVDGNINEERIRQLTPMGVTNFVMGTALFNGDYKNIIKNIKRGR